MVSKIVNANGVYDLSGVDNLKNLQEEIAFLQDAVKKEEESLENHFTSLPRHFAQSTAESLLPAFFNKLLANGAWKLLLSSLTLFANPFAKGFSFKKNIVRSAKRLGLIALVKTAFSLLGKRGSEKPHPVTVVKRPEVTTLKTTKNIRKG